MADQGRAGLTETDMARWRAESVITNADSGVVKHYKAVILGLLDEVERLRGER